MEYLTMIGKSNKIFETHYFSKLKKTSALLMLTMLTSCGGGSGGGSEESSELTVSPIPDLSGSFKYLGYIDLVDDSLVSRVNIDANFFEFVDIQDASNFGTSVPQAEDSCHARVLDAIPSNAGSTIGFPELPFTLLSTSGGGAVGKMVTFTSSGGTYATYALSDSRFDIAPRPIPDNLMLDLMAGPFPEFLSVAVPELPKITNLQPQEITQGTVFTWSPLDANTGSIYIDYVNFVAPTTTGSLSSKYVEIYCRMQNDGEFALPQVIEDILTEKLGSDFVLTGVSRALKAINVVIKDDAAFVISRRNESF